MPRRNYVIRKRLCTKKSKFICHELPIIIRNQGTIKEALTRPMVYMHLQHSHIFVDSPFRNIGTDEYAKYCRGFLWVELGCFIGETEDLKNYGKLLPSEWYSVDTGFDTNDPKTKKLFSDHMTKLKEQLRNDSQKRKWDYLLGDDSSSISSSSSKTNFKKSLKRQESDSPDMTDIVRAKTAEINVLQAIASSLKPPVSEHELTVSKRADILMFLASKNTPHNDLVLGELLRLAGVDVPVAL